MTARTIAFAALFALTGTAALAQGASEQGAPTAAGANSYGSRTSPGAVKNGSSLGPGDGPVIIDNGPGTVGMGRGPLPDGASESGAPTAAGRNSMGDGTEPGAVQRGTSR